ncbi:hypothetical protein EDB83DRAFT_2310700 [Lactarius deliciosus]|nr:hypothetical protein EDB83DRAFT_2310700 [Lactarius deliciosus]
MNCHYKRRSFDVSMIDQILIVQPGEEREDVPLGRSLPTLQSTSPHATEGSGDVSTDRDRGVQPVGFLGGFNGTRDEFGEREPGFCRDRCSSHGSLASAFKRSPGLTANPLATDIPTAESLKLTSRAYPTSVAVATSASAVAVWPSDSASASNSIRVNVVWDIELGPNSPSLGPIPVHEEQESLLWDICQAVTGWWREG